MQIDLVSPIPEAQWPDGISVRTVQEGVDDQVIYEFIQDAFDQPGRTRPTFEQWHQHMERSDIFDPELWFLAMAGQEMVGACLCFDYPSGGWVRQLGVAKEWRRQGIGQALLQHTFRVFQERGASNVGLTVESERPDAVQFYLEVGMRQVRQYDEYIRPLFEQSMN
jgi:ribosomal protein S18 acetylase RimI-like enzyme